MPDVKTTILTEMAADIAAATGRQCFTNLSSETTDKPYMRLLLRDGAFDKIDANRFMDKAVTAYCLIFGDGTDEIYTLQTTLEKLFEPLPNDWGIDVWDIFPSDEELPMDVAETVEELDGVTAWQVNYRVNYVA